MLHRLSSKAATTATTTNIQINFNFRVSVVATNRLDGRVSFFTFLIQFHDQFSGPAFDKEFLA